MEAIVATLGFDERHVVRSILRLGFGNVASIELLIPSDGLEEKTAKAIEEIKKLAAMAGVESVNTHEVPVEDFYRAIGRIRKLLLELLGRGLRITVSLGGGLRALVVETLFAIVLLPHEGKQRTRVFVDLETGKGYIEFKPALPIHLDITPLEEELLKIFTVKSTLALREALEFVKAPRSTIWKELEKLVAKGYLEKEGAIYKLSPLGKMVLHAIVQPQ